MAGEGPAMLLIHGITSSSARLGRADGATWSRPATRWSPRTSSATELRRSRRATTRSAPTPAASATCSGLLGVEKATVVGHSLGGGIALQVAYQYPESAERLVLISSGGLGREVSPLLRAATLPGRSW